MKFIYHVVPVNDWAASENQPVYTAASFLVEGFIHLSEKEQVAGVLERYYKGRQDLLLLQIAPDRLTAELKYEPATNAEYFPHLYGPINKDAVMAVEKIMQD
ncbi:DUF952 domain-containing protein [Spirosoma sp. KUDC1026]|uniref:DUF952 domain-containing protein n=1 Tax=Spirosoma sp. KUDC1026 TaxID=2745947 RepID=UPI00159BDCB8|nr:DUF952 domain-containing protein [Spirosoma sp. KUDC1026]QKZ11533.1 DUF952 domain-containing protein [Spirosoma sp. KUDC1026]